MQIRLTALLIPPLSILAIMFTPVSASAQNDCAECLESQCPSGMVFVDCDGADDFGPLIDGACETRCWPTGPDIDTCTDLRDCHPEDDMDLDFAAAAFSPLSSAEAAAAVLRSHGNVELLPMRSAVAVLGCSDEIRGVFPLQRSVFDLLQQEVHASTRSENGNVGPGS